MVEEEERRCDWLSKKEMGLELARVGAPHLWCPSWWECIGVDELADLEGEAKERRELHAGASGRLSGFGRCGGGG